MKFLDTTFLIDLIRGEQGIETITTELDKLGPHSTSVINYHEFLVGGFGSTSENELNLRRKVLNKLIILDFDVKAAEISSKIEAELRNKGDFVGTADIIIAAIMLSNGIHEILTKNVKHFERIEDIKIIDY